MVPPAPHRPSTLPSVAPPFTFCAKKTHHPPSQPVHDDSVFGRSSAQQAVGEGAAPSRAAAAAEAEDSPDFGHAHTLGHAHQFGHAHADDLAVQRAYERLRAMRKAKLAGKGFARPALTRNEVRSIHE